MAKIRLAMGEITPQIIPIPREGYRGIQALIALGEDQLALLADAMAAEPLNLSFADVTLRISERLHVEQRTVHMAFVHALLPFSGLRRNFEMTPPDFLSALLRTTSEFGPAEWKKENLENWKRISNHLLPFLQPDSFFSQASKALDLLSERPAVLQSARLLTELRPIYNEATTRTLAQLRTTTLVVDYSDGQTTHSLHVSLDDDDLRRLEEEVGRAKTKIMVIHKEACESGNNLISYGNSLNWTE